jgi:hypothetical protein
MRARTHAWALRRTKPCLFVSHVEGIVHPEIVTTLKLADALLFSSRREALVFQVRWNINLAYKPVSILCRVPR